jgi:hypothetical protein
MAPGIIARQSTAPVIGWLSSASAPPHWTAAFHDGLKSFGYVAEQNVTIEYRRSSRDRSTSFTDAIVSAARPDRAMRPQSYGIVVKYQAK